MADSRRIHVTDTNIWIDLDADGIVQEMFQLPFQFVAPDLVVEELKKPDGGNLVLLGLRKEELTGDEVRLVGQLASRYPAPSRVDLSALALAKARGGVLLTGDRRLRKAAEQEKTPVHGTLWILEELVRRRIVTPPKAARSLEEMRAKGSRLPSAECERRLKKWKR